jgi:outer membrane protein assembly factor BamE
MLLRAFIAAAALLLAACGSMRLPTRSDVDKIVTPHRIEIQQGNFISQEMVSQLQAGQTKDQVRFILGTPLIADSFHGDRWDYVFWRIRANSRDLEQRKITVFFEAGKLKRVEGDVTPAASR